MNRQIVFDTETTGLDKSDRIIEFGAVELIDGKKTGKVMQIYFNPGINISNEVIAIHGITNEMVKDKKSFKDHAQEIINFISGAELIAHNADFDVKMLDNEIILAGKGNLAQYCSKITDTLFLAKHNFPDLKRFSLDNLCAKLKIKVPKVINNNGVLEVLEGEVPPEDGKKFDRGVHSALVDSQMLADVYLKMDVSKTMDSIIQRVDLTNWVRPEIKRLSVKEFKNIEFLPEDILESKKFDLFLAKENKQNDKIDLLTKEIKQLEESLPVVYKKPKSMSFNFGK